MKIWKGAVIVKSDRRTYRRPREPVNKRRFAWKSGDWIPAFAGMTNWRGLLTRGKRHPERSEGSVTVNEILRPEKAGLRMTDSLCGDPPLGKPPTGFSESDVGELARHLLGGPPGVECDVGRTVDNSMSSLKTFRRSKGFSDEPSEGHKAELETTRLTEDEVRDGCCLTMDSKRFQLCQN